MSGEQYVVKEVPYFSSGSVWIGVCSLCEYQTGKGGTERQAEQAVAAHFSAKHGS